MLTRVVVFLLFFGFISVNANARKTEVSNFDNLFTLKFSLNNSFANYAQEKFGYEFYSNRPADIGVGFGYKDFSLGFSINIPQMYDEDYSKSKSFDVNGNYFFKDSAVFNGYIKKYNGFYNDYAHNIDAKILTFGFSGEYIFNKNHSPRSAYNLDRRQSVSNGSFLIGGGVFFTSIDLDDGVPISSKELHFGPNFGYSYTWVIKNNFFINAAIVMGINGIKDNEDFSFGMHYLPKIAMGYHGETWSANIFGGASALMNNIHRSDAYILFSGTYGIVFSKRI